MKMTFLDWYELFTEELCKIGYDRQIDKDEAMRDYNNDLSPEESAKAFVEEIDNHE
jgi:hypothetical protein